MALNNGFLQVDAPHGHGALPHQPGDHLDGVPAEDVQERWGLDLVHLTGVQERSPKWRTIQRSTTEAAAKALVAKEAKVSY